MTTAWGKVSALPSLSQFPGGQDVYRIDWFGPVSFPSRSTRGAQIAIEVRLSLVRHPDRINDPDWVASADFGALKFAYVSVGQLVFLRIGDLWCNGSPWAVPAYEQETFSDVDISRSTVQFVKAGQSVDGKYLLPWGEHPFHFQCTHSNCILVELTDQRRLIVPAVELIRFYFGSSSKLLGALFSAGLEKESLFTHARDADGVATLVLAEGMPRSSVDDVARLAFSDSAWNAARLTNRSLARKDPEQDNVFPSAKFPFFGRTTLVAKGKWLSLGARPRSTFVVFSLQSCSHPFPYRHLQYTVAGEELDSLRDDELAARSRDEESTGTLVEEDANPALSAKAFYAHGVMKFPDLRFKRAEHAGSNVAAQSAPMARGTGPVTDKLAVGPAIGTSDVRPADVIACSESEAPPFVRWILSLLEHLPGTSELMTHGETDGWSTRLEQSFDAYGAPVQTSSRAAAFLLNGEVGPRWLMVFDTPLPLAAVMPVVEGKSWRDALMQGGSRLDVGASVQAISDLASLGLQLLQRRDSVLWLSAPEKAIDG